MKQVWSSPKTSFEQFVPQNYIAACGDSGVVYKFKCDAGSEWNTYNVYLENGTPYATNKKDTYCNKDFSGFQPCGSTHEADSESGFLKGYMYARDWFGNEYGDRIDVVIWTENCTNVHCTKELDMSKWETAKS